MASIRKCIAGCPTLTGILHEFPSTEEQDRRLKWFQQFGFNPPTNDTKIYYACSRHFSSRMINACQVYKSGYPDQLLTMYNTKIPYGNESKVEIVNTTNGPITGDTSEDDEDDEDEDEDGDDDDEDGDDEDEDEQDDVPKVFNKANFPVTGDTSEDDEDEDNDAKMSNDNEPKVKILNGTNVAKTGETSEDDDSEDEQEDTNEVKNEDECEDKSEGEDGDGDAGEVEDEDDSDDNIWSKAEEDGLKGKQCIMGCENARALRKLPPIRSAMEQRKKWLYLLGKRPNLYLSRDLYVCGRHFNKEMKVGKISLKDIYPNANLPPPLQAPIPKELEAQTECILNCTVYIRKYKFPPMGNNPIRRGLWLKQFGLDLADYQHEIFACDRHFSDTMFIDHYLHPHALPVRELKYMPHCILNCKEANGFRRLPSAETDMKQRKQWLYLLGKKPNEYLTKHLYVCEQHFDKEMLDAERDPKDLYPNANLPPPLQEPIPIELDAETECIQDCEDYERKYRFPSIDSDAARRALWLRQFGLDLDGHRHEIYACERHFSDDMFIDHYLHPQALPFSEPKNLPRCILNCKKPCAFRKFPSLEIEMERRNKWFYLIGKNPNEFLQKRNLYLCGLHFDKEMLAADREPKDLYPNANLPPPLQEPIPKALEAQTECILKCTNYMRKYRFPPVGSDAARRRFWFKQFGLNADCNNADLFACDRHFRAIMFVNHYLQPHAVPFVERKNAPRCILNCKKPYAFRKFPSAETELERRNKWFYLIEKNPSKYSDKDVFICEYHFDKEMLDPNRDPKDIYPNANVEPQAPIPKELAAQAECILKCMDYERLYSFPRQFTKCNRRLLWFQNFGVKVGLAQDEIYACDRHFSESQYTEHNLCPWAIPDKNLKRPKCIMKCRNAYALRSLGTTDTEMEQRNKWLHLLGKNPKHYLNERLFVCEKHFDSEMLADDKDPKDIYPNVNLPPPLQEPLPIELQAQAECILQCKGFERIYSFPSIQTDMARRRLWHERFRLDANKDEIFACDRHFSEKQRIGHYLQPYAKPDKNLEMPKCVMRCHRIRGRAFFILGSSDSEREQRNKWLHLLGKSPKDYLNEYLYVCDRHFDKEMLALDKNPKDIYPNANLPPPLQEPITKELQAQTKCIIDCEDYIRMYKFPSLDNDVVRRRLWLRQFGLNSDDYQHDIYACDRHFGDGMLVDNCLRPDAFPFKELNNDPHCLLNCKKSHKFRKLPSPETDMEQRKKWLCLLGKNPNEYLAKNLYLCEQHFDKQMLAADKDPKDIYPNLQLPLQPPISKQMQAETKCVLSCKNYNRLYRFPPSRLKCDRRRLWFEKFRLKLSLYKYQLYACDRHFSENQCVYHYLRLTAMPDKNIDKPKCILECKASGKLHSLGSSDSELEQRNKWLRLLGREPKNYLDDYLYVCERHFDKEMLTGAKDPKDIYPCVNLPQEPMPKELNAQTECILKCMDFERIYSFPTIRNNVARRCAWLERFNLDLQDYTHEIFACDRHFSEKQLFGRYLRPYAVPDRHFQKRECIMRCVNTRIFRTLTSADSEREQRNKWLHLLGRDPKHYLNEYLHVCEMHFDEEMITGDKDPKDIYPTKNLQPPLQEPLPKDLDMQTECILKCINYKRKYRFPSMQHELTRRRMWLQKFGLGLHNSLPQEIFACDRHFSQDMFAGHCLHPDTVPNQNFEKCAHSQFEITYARSEFMQSAPQQPEDPLDIHTAGCNDDTDTDKVKVEVKEEPVELQFTSFCILNDKIKVEDETEAEEPQVGSVYISNAEVKVEEEVVQVEEPQSGNIDYEHELNELRHKKDDNLRCAVKRKATDDDVNESCSSNGVKSKKCARALVENKAKKGVMDITLNAANAPTESDVTTAKQTLTTTSATTEVINISDDEDSLDTIPYLLDSRSSPLLKVLK